MKYTIVELAKMFGISTCVIQHYRKLGIITPVGRGTRNMLIFDEEAVKAIQIKRKGIKFKTTNLRKPSKCWTCLNAYGNKCPWASKGLPVPGWKAEKLILTGMKRPSYNVNSCPLYEREKFYIDEKGIKRRVNTVPEMNERDNLDILDLYQNSKKFL